MMNAGWRPARRSFARAVGPDVQRVVAARSVTPLLCPASISLEGVQWQRPRLARPLDRQKQARPAVVEALKVRNAADVEEVVRAAIAGEQSLEIIGHGTKRQVGQVMATNAVLDLSALNAVLAYEPNELII